MVSMGNEVAENKSRRMIFNHIINHPGVSFSIIKQVFGLTESTLRYHLNYLETRNEIRSIIHDRNKCYYPNQKHIFDTRIESELSIQKLNPIQERLINTIQLNPGVTQKDLIFKTKLKRITIAQNLKKLLDFGILRKEPNGRLVCYYFITDAELREKVLKKLITMLLNDEIDEKTFLALKRKLD
jgi:predicted transcriptional regulator